MTKVFCQWPRLQLSTAHFKQYISHVIATLKNVLFLMVVKINGKLHDKSM